MDKGRGELKEQSCIGETVMTDVLGEEGDTDTGGWDTTGNGDGEDEDRSGQRGAGSFHLRLAGFKTELLQK